MKFKKIFKNNKKVIIGALHTPPLLGYKDFPGIKVVLDQAKKDLAAFEKGKVDAIIFENNYDIPHKTAVDSSVAISLFQVGQFLKAKTKLPIGVSVLWNDYKTALSLAKILNLDFIRIPVFIDEVKTNYGVVRGNPRDVISYRKKINAENVAIFTDIHVKHAEILSKKSLVQSAKEASKNNSDAIIITGKWTGDAPSIEGLKQIKKAKINIPIILGSGVDEKNIKNLFEYSDGAIISTSLKNGKSNKNQTNLKLYSQRVSRKKTEALVKAARI